MCQRRLIFAAIRQVVLCLVFVFRLIALSDAQTSIELTTEDQRSANLSDEDFFEQFIRPMFVNDCLACHRVGEESGGLSLESRSQLIEGGDRGSIVDFIHPENSLILTVVQRTGEVAMPPEQALPPDKVDALRQWVKRGAPWPEASGRLSWKEKKSDHTSQQVMHDHWAYQPVKAVDVPLLQEPLYSHVQNEIDYFLLETLAAQRLDFADPADRRTLIRRATYDLTGLPPTHAEVQGFLDDVDENAWEKVVDRLLDSPRYGEKWAKPWLDLARYSDSKGYVYAREERFWVHAWVYRDWVIQALNQDLPYDQFIRLQIAADEYSSNASDMAAMGFLTLGRRFLGVSHDIIDDRIDVVSRATMATTIACARCHDHKYDPLSIEDYYSLYGIFRNCEETLVSISDERDLDTAFTEGLVQRQTKLSEVMDRHRQSASNRVRERVRDYLEAQLHLEDYPEAGFDQIYQENDIIPEFVRRWRDYLELQSESNDRLFGLWHRLIAVDDEDFDAFASQVCDQIQQAGEDAVHPEILKRFQEPPKHKIEMVERYAALFTDYLNWIEGLGEEHGDQIHSDERWNVLFHPEGPCEIPDESITHTERYFPTSHTEEIWKLQAEVDRWIRNSDQSVKFALALFDKKERMLDAHVMRRGDPTLLGERVERRFPLSFGVFDPDDPTIAKTYGDGSGRAQLARAITSPNNPLTARVAVNRIWAQHFGSGLVETLSDFGTRADPPSHPELLDWLTRQFIDRGWRLKPIHRMIMLSNAYRQSSLDSHTPHLEQARDVDPKNRLLWRYPSRRLEFESLRDSILFVSGDCDLTLGGKSVSLFDSQRRTIYCETDRQFFASAMRTFDVASPDLSIATRAQTTIPQQALFFLNHPFVVKHASRLVQGLESESIDDRIREIYKRVLGRDPASAELDFAQEFVSLALPTVDPSPVEDSTVWSYGMGHFDQESASIQGFIALPYFSGNAWQGGSEYPDGKLGWVQLTPEGGHPGNTIENASIRRWIAPESMTIRIDSQFIHEPQVGDGVHAMIVSSRTGVLSQANIFHQSIPMVIDLLEVEKGEIIDFVVDIREVLNSDQYLWAPTISRVNSSTSDGNGSEVVDVWDSRAEFRGSPFVELDPWVAFAQVLLSSNEFIFVD